MPLDIAIGFLGAIAYALVTGEDLTPSLLLLGGVFALLPDTDFVVSAIRKRSVAKVDHTHRDLLHYPIPYVLLGGALVLVLAPQYLWLFVGLSLWHFVHDSAGVGWGVPWLFPFSRRYLKLAVDHQNRYAAFSAAWWTPEHRSTLIARLHDTRWNRNLYTHTSFTLVLEGGVLLLMLALAFAATAWL